MTMLMIVYGQSQEYSNDITLDLTFYTGGEPVSTYKGVKIGEYYWIDNNFYAPPFNTATLAQIKKHMDVWAVPYNVSAEDFNRYYGEYYGLLNIPSGQMYENGNPSEGWMLPSISDFDQLLAMCGTGSYKDIKEYLGASEGDNPAAVSLKESADISNGHWFSPNKNIYKFNLMPGGGRINGDWENLLKGDFYALYKSANLRLDYGGVINFDNLSNRVVYGAKLWHWINVRFTKRIPDKELGYKLYIKEVDYKKYVGKELIPGFDVTTVDIKKLGLQEAAPAGYIELQNGWIRGFYIQKNGTDSVPEKIPQLISHLRIFKENDSYTYVFKEKETIIVYLRTNDSDINNINLGIYNPKNGDLRGTLKILSRNNFIYKCELPDNIIGSFMLVAYVEKGDGEKIQLKREKSSPWIDRLPIVVENRFSRNSYIPSDKFEITSYMQLNIIENGRNIVNRKFQTDLDSVFKVSISENTTEVVRIGLFYSNGDFYTDVTKSNKGSVYNCSVPNLVMEGEYILMPYIKENGIIKVIERNKDAFYIDYHYL